MSAQVAIQDYSSHFNIITAKSSLPLVTNPMLLNFICLCKCGPSSDMHKVGLCLRVQAKF